MTLQPKSLRAFIGAKDYTISRKFYSDIGFEEIVISENMSYFKTGDFGFYLQDYYAKDWINNSMVFLEIKNLKEQLTLFKNLKIAETYKVKLTDIHYYDWGNEFFLHDPSGVLWHFGEFNMR